MYTAKFQVIVEKMPFSQEKSSSQLNASFRFGHEVSDNDRKVLGKRYSYDSLTKYFEASEGLKKTIGPVENETYYVDNIRRELKVFPCSFRLGFDVRVISNEKMPLEKMLDLDALNQFVLTGEMPQSQGAPSQ